MLTINTSQLSRAEEHIKLVSSIQPDALEELVRFRLGKNARERFSHFCPEPGRAPIPLAVNQLVVGLEHLE